MKCPRKVKWICGVLCIVLLLTTGIAAFSESTEVAFTDPSKLSESEIMALAVEQLKDSWTNTFKKRDLSEKGYLQILHTQICYINPDYVPVKRGYYLQDVYCMVEFTLLNDFYGLAPYYPDLASGNAVLFMCDGSIKVETSPFLKAQQRYSLEDFRNAIVSVTQTDEYNAVYYLLDKP